MDSLSLGSYMLKHSLDMHEGEKLHASRFGVKILKYTRTSFERQILESVKLQENSGHNLLNSKAEYNRCAIPRLTTKIGEKLYEKWAKEEKNEKEKDDIIEEKIRNLRRERNRRRRNNPEENRENEPPPPAKRRRKDEGEKQRKKTELEKWMVVEPPQKDKNKKSPSSTEREEENFPEGRKDEEKEEKALSVGERITYISGTIVDAEKEKEEQAPENTLGESVPQELELWVMVEPQN